MTNQPKQICQYCNQDITNILHTCEKGRVIKKFRADGSVEELCNKCGRVSKIVDLSHNCPFCSPSNKEPKEQWEVEFDNKFTVPYMRDTGTYEEILIVLKSFIRTLLLSKDTEWVEKVKRVEEEKEKIVETGDHNQDNYNLGVIEGIERVLEILKSLK